MKKFYKSLRENSIKLINSRNEFTNKRVVGIIIKCKNMLYL